MTKADFKRFAVAWTSALKIYGAEADPETISLVFKLLADQPLSDIEAALTAHLLDQDRGRYAPKPADIIAKLENSADETLEIAWTEFRAATRGGVMPKDNPALCNVIRRLGGLELLGDKTSKEVDFLRNSFLLLYRAASDTPIHASLNVYATPKLTDGR